MNKQHHLHKYASFIIFSRLLLLHYCLRLLRINRTVPIIFQNKANVIAALNGPMAHIYLRNGNVWDTTLPDATELRKLAQHIKLYLKDGGAKIKSEKVKAQFKNLLSSVDIILIRENGALTIGKDILNAYHKMETIEHFAYIAFVAQQLGVVKTLNPEQVKKLIDLRERHGIRTQIGCNSCETDNCSLTAEPTVNGIPEDQLIQKITAEVIRQLRK